MAPWTPGLRHRLELWNGSPNLHDPADYPRRLLDIDRFELRLKRLDDSGLRHLAERLTGQVERGSCGLS